MKLKKNILNITAYWYPACVADVCGSYTANTATIQGAKKWTTRDFLNIFNRTTDFHRSEKLTVLKNWTFLSKNLSANWSNQPGKIVLTAGQFTCCVALNQAPWITFSILGIKEKSNKQMWDKRLTVYQFFSRRWSTTKLVGKTKQSTTYNKNWSNVWSTRTHCTNKLESCLYQPNVSLTNNNNKRIIQSNLT